VPAPLIRWLVLFAGATGAGLCWMGVVGGDLPATGRASLAVTSLAVGLWGSELVDLPVTALLAMVLLYVGGAVARPEAAFVGFSSPVLFFLIGSTALGIAAEHTGLADRLAGWLLRRSGGSGRRLLLELLVSLPAQAFLVPSAMSRNAVLVPVYDRVLGRLGRPAQLGASTMLTLGVLGPLASSALLSGGTSPVVAAQAIGGFTWATWFIALAPPYYVLLAADALVLWWICRPEPNVEDSTLAADAVPSKPLAGAEWRVAAISLATSLLWVLDALTGWPPAVPAMLAMVALMTPPLGVMDWRAFAARAPWATSVILAGAVSLADALARSGAAAWIARALFGWLPPTDNPLAIALAIFSVTALITLAIPNRAAAITLGVPLATAYATAGSFSAAAAGLIVMIVVDAETIYPAQTATNLIAYGRGYFSAGMLAKFNLITLAIALAVVLGVALPWWSLIGLPGG
jgi:anion transporter